MDSALSSPTALRVSRRFAAPRERVFRAWTEAPALRKWFRVAEGYATPIAEVDLRVGGRYRLGMQAPDATEPQIVGGVYREISPPERLVFTWQWEGAPPEAPETIVTVEFHQHGSQTEVVLTHEGFPDRPARDQHGAGWQGCFDGLAAAVTAHEV
jgi:uncharacterized protein YndB with AHSA1/START domain